MCEQDAFSPPHGLGTRLSANKEDPWDCWSYSAIPKVFDMAELDMCDKTFGKVFVVNGQPQSRFVIKIRTLCAYRAHRLLMSQGRHTTVWTRWIATGSQISMGNTSNCLAPLVSNRNVLFCYFKI